jgi:hypothetical protein
MNSIGHFAEGKFTSTEDDVTADETSAEFSMGVILLCLLVICLTRLLSSSDHLVSNVGISS